MKVINILILLFVFSHLSIAKSNAIEIEYIRYDFLGSYKAIISKPKGKGPFPAIIYNYDEFYDWAGIKLANQQGYNLEYIAGYFAKLGYVCLIPIERYRKLKAIIGIATYIKDNPDIAVSSINLVGMSEGAALSITAATQLPDISSLTLIGPIEVNDKGFLSNQIFNFLKPKNPHIPIYFIQIHDVGWRIRSQHEVYLKLKTIYTNITFKKVYKQKRWFWDIDRYGKDINLFITKQYNRKYATRKNTYKSAKY
jgi:hypothetical protein